METRKLEPGLMSLLGRRQGISFDTTEKDLQEALLVKDDIGCLPIHYACMYDAPLEVIQMLLDSDTDKKSILVKGFLGRLPIHVACAGGATLEVIQLLLESDVGKKTIFEKTELGELPIHKACTGGATLEVIQLLLDSDADKKTIFEKTDFGKVPIHYACYGGLTVEFIQLLLDSDEGKKTILVKDRFGRLPIHCACSAGSTVEVIRLLLDSDAENKSIFEKDDYGQLPIQYACEEDGPVEVVQLLLLASIGDRLEQLGLKQWKIGLEELINAMTEEDSKTKKVRHIYTRLSKYEEMEGTISLLALAVCRTSCLKWGDIQFKSMQEMDDLRATDETFDPVEYKRVRRIKSGADVIIRGVLPFLPVDDDSDSESSFSDDAYGADHF